MSPKPIHIYTSLGLYGDKRREDYPTTDCVGEVGGTYITILWVHGGVKYSLLILIPKHILWFVLSEKECLPPVPYY